MYLGIFTNGRFLNYGNSIVVNRKTGLFEVNKGKIQSRPDGSRFLSGVRYSACGAISSGLFGSDGELIIQLEFKSDSADNFLDMGRDLVNVNFRPRYLKYSAY